MPKSDRVKGPAMAEAIERARHAAIHSLARELDVDLPEAQRWCAAWERYAARNGVPHGRYFWDSARGWIDAHRTFTRSPSAPLGDEGEVTTQVIRVAGFRGPTIQDVDQRVRGSTSRG